jgi:DNA-binding PadR family transcriptional regulator
MSNDRNRELRFYRLTASGKKHLLRQESKWKQMTEAIVRLMWPAEGGQAG